MLCTTSLLPLSHSPLLSSPVFLHHSPLPPLPAVMFSICFDGSSSERGKWFRPLACMAGLQLDTAPAAPKNKLFECMLVNFFNACICVCVCSVCTSIFFSGNLPLCFPPFLLSCFFSFLLFPHLRSHTGSVRQIKIMRCLKELWTVPKLQPDTEVLYGNL